MREFTITTIYEEDGKVAHYSILANDDNQDLIVEIPSGSKISLSIGTIEITICED